MSVKRVCDWDGNEIDPGDPYVSFSLGRAAGGAGGVVEFEATKDFHTDEEAASYLNGETYVPPGP